jgi:hypothetical protein
MKETVKQMIVDGKRISKAGIARELNISIYKVNKMLEGVNLEELQLEIYRELSEAADINEEEDSTAFVAVNINTGEFKEFDSIENAIDFINKKIGDYAVEVEIDDCIINNKIIREYKLSHVPYIKDNFGP